MSQYCPNSALSRQSGLEDLDGCTKSFSDFEEYTPELGKVVGTPLASIWKDGILGDKRFGLRVIKLMSALGVPLE